MATEPPEAHVHHFGQVGRSFICNTCGGWLSIWIGLCGWGHPMAMWVCQWRIISLAITKRAASSDSVADTIINLTIWAMERMAPLNRRNRSFSERKMCASSWLWKLVSLRNHASEWAHRIIVKRSSRWADWGLERGKKWYTEVEYVPGKTKYFIMSYNSGFCLINVQALAVNFANAPSQLFWEEK